MPFEFKPPTQMKGDHRLESKVDLSLIDPNLNEWLDSLGLYASHCRYFYMPAWTAYPLHIDVSAYENQYARLNFIVGGEGSVMSWYKLLPGKERTLLPNQVGEPVAIYNEDECEEIHRVKDLQGPNLLNVGIIHTVKNPKVDRHCYAFALRTKQYNIRLQWKQAYEIFKPFCL